MHYVGVRKTEGEFVLAFQQVEASCILAMCGFGNEQAPHPAHAVKVCMRCAAYEFYIGIAAAIVGRWLYSAETLAFNHSVMLCAQLCIFLD